MSEYDFDGETRNVMIGVKNFDKINDALCRAYAAGQASGFGSELWPLVALAATHPGWQIDPGLTAPIVRDCAALLEALKAQAVAK